MEEEEEGGESELRRTSVGSNNEEISIPTLLPSLLVVYLFTRRRGEMGPCGKTSRPLVRHVPPFLPFSVHEFLPDGKRCPSTPRDSTARVVTLARFLRATSSRTRSSGRPRSFPLIFRDRNSIVDSDGGCRCCCCWYRAANRSRRKDKKKRRERRKRTHRAKETACR